MVSGIRSVEPVPSPGGTLERQRRPRWGVAAREVAFIGAAALLYSLVRGLTDNRVDAAFANAERVIEFEQSLGLFVEPRLQEAALSHPASADLANAVYIWGYWPVLGITLLWLLVRHPAAYPLYRNALLASGALSLAVFAAFPLAPPRFLPEYGFVDTIALRSSGYRDFNASALVNEYAAMPSLHFGWVLLLAIAWVTVARHRVVRLGGVVLPALMFAAVVLTGNHFIVDGVVAGVIVLAGLGAAAALRRRYGTPGAGGLW